MKKPLFTGACTALVTPFLNGEVNFPMLERLISRQIEAGIQAIVICGTTGESATLTDGEKLALITRAKEYAKKDCLIIAGTGSNATEHTVQLSKAAEDAGADALLIVSPYYNKATPEGLIQHFSAAAFSVHLPVILYNVPSRTGLDIPVPVYKQLASVSNIVGVKEASTDLSKILAIRAECPEDFHIWSGNDDLTVPILSLGGKGVISVLSNLYPELTQAMAAAALDGDFDTAAALQIEFGPLIRALFSQVNPIPVKAAMKLLGYDCGPCRLPLTAPSLKLMQQLKTALHAVGNG
ncbi:MAG: 4-hydroxy-tetrahydrodipicolinate synthase [Faecousia sp.]